MHQEKNRFTPTYLSGVLVLAVCLMVPVAHAATTVQVGTCMTGPTSYATIGAAVYFAATGSIIDVCPGTYPEQVVITKKLTLIGVQSGTAGATAVVAAPASGVVPNVYDIHGHHIAAQIAVLNSSVVTISNLTVDGSGNNLSGCGTNLEGIYFQNSTGTITQNVVRSQILDSADLGCQVGLAINVESNSGGNPAVTISNNSVHNYQKNGITAKGSGVSGLGGPKATVTGNTVIGIGATPAIAQNGIEISFGATGKVSGNYVADNVYTGGYWASSGILIYAAADVTASANTVENAQYAIATASDPTYGVADGATISSNHIGGAADAIDLCSNNNTATSNTIYGSTQDGAHSDDTCTSGSVVSGNNNTITGNTINEACAGVLLGTGTGTTSSPNTFLNVTNTTLAGDVCPAVGSEVKTRAGTPVAKVASTVTRTC